MTIANAARVETRARGSRVGGSVRCVGGAQRGRGRGAALLIGLVVTPLCRASTARRC